MHLKVLVQVQPSAVRARLTVAAISEDPCLLLGGKCDTSLILRKKFVVDADVAVRRTSNDDFVSREILLVVVDLTS